MVSFIGLLCCSIAKSCPALCNPNGLQHARLPYLSLSPQVWSDSCPSSWWCHPTISSCFPILLLPSTFPSIKIFSNELALCTRWPKCLSFSFSISPSNEYSGLTSFRIDRDWSPCCPRYSQESSPKPQFKNNSSSALSLLYGPTLTSVHYYWKNHSFDYTGKTITLLAKWCLCFFTGY